MTMPTRISDLYIRLLSCLCLLAAPLGCGQGKGQPDSPEDYYGQAEATEITRDVEFTSDPYQFSGPTDIETIRSLVPSNTPVWYGVSPDLRYAQGESRVIDQDCDAGFFENNFNGVSELPAVIEGVVTLPPPQFRKAPVCGQEQRYEGSYMLSDSTGGILVLQNVNFGDFGYGDRIRLRVRGVVKFFDTIAVLVHDQTEIVSEDEPIHYKSVERAFGTQDLDRVRRVTGTVDKVPTNKNFNAMTLTGPDDIQWAVSLNRDFGLRGIPIRKEDKIRVTGPVIRSFGTDALTISSYGQIEWINRNPFEITSE